MEASRVFAWFSSTDHQYFPRCFLSFCSAQHHISSFTSVHITLFSLYQTPQVFPSSCAGSGMLASCSVLLFNFLISWPSLSVELFQIAFLWFLCLRPKALVAAAGSPRYVPAYLVESQGIWIILWTGMCYLIRVQNDVTVRGKYPHFSRALHLNQIMFLWKHRRSDCPSFLQSLVIEGVTVYDNFWDKQG